MSTAATVRTVHVNRVQASPVKAPPPPIPVRRIHSLPDRTISEQSQLDDILTDLLNDPLFADGSRTFEFSNEADGTYGTISANHGSITTAHSPRRGRHQFPAFGAGGGGGGGAGGSRTVVSWQTNQTGPKRTVAINRKTIERPTANSAIEIMSSKRFDTESAAKPSSGRSQPGGGWPGSTAPGGGSVFETRRTETRTETTTRREGQQQSTWSTSGTGGYDDGPTAASKTGGARPPSPPMRRRLVSAPESAPPSNSYRNYGSDTDDFRRQATSSTTWKEEKRTGRRQQSSWRNPTDVVQSDTEDYFRPSGTDRRWPKPSYDDPYLSDDMAPYFNQQQQHTPRLTAAKSGRPSALQPRARTFDLESPTSRTTYETRRSFFVSGIERPPNTTRQTKYTFSVSPQRSFNDDEDDVQKLPPVPPQPRVPSPVLPPLRSDSSREAVLRVNLTREQTSSRWENERSHSPSLDELERSLQSVQLLLDAHSANKRPPEAAPVDEAPVSNQRQTTQQNVPVEMEDEIISLRPIGPGMQNLEPEDPARFRSMTPAFPTQQRVVSPFPVTPTGPPQQPLPGFPVPAPSEFRPPTDISPQSPVAPASRTVPATAPTAAVEPSTAADIDEFAALMDFSSSSSPPLQQQQQQKQQSVAQRPDQLQPQRVQKNLSSPRASNNANAGSYTTFEQRTVTVDQQNSLPPAASPTQLSPTSADTIYNTPRRLGDYGGVTSSPTSLQSGYGGTIESQSWLQQKQFQQQQLQKQQKLPIQSGQQSFNQTVAYQSQQSPVSAGPVYARPGNQPPSGIIYDQQTFHHQPGFVQQSVVYQQQQYIPSSSDGVTQYGSKQESGLTGTSTGYGLQQQQQQHLHQETMQRQVIGQQHAAAASQTVQAASQADETLGSGTTVRKEVTTHYERHGVGTGQGQQGTWSTWSPASRPIVVQDFSGQNAAEQSSTLTRSGLSNQDMGSETTMTRSYQQRQHSSGAANGSATLLNVTTRRRSPDVARSLSVGDRGRSVSPSDMALRARLQSRLETKSPGLVGGTTSPSIYAGHSRTNSLTSLTDGEIIQHSPRFVRDTSKYWHKPHITREDAINLLRDKPPGSFVVRNSNTFQGAFGLALKVFQLPPNVHMKEGVDPQSELVRHFLIEPTSKGVRLKGCSNEPVFGSLAALVYQHTILPMALPCKLILPEVDIADVDAVDASSTGTLAKTQLYQQGAACNVLYIGSFDMESLTGPEALSRAIAKTFPAGSQTPPNTTVVHFKVSSQGITLTDNKHRLFFRRHYPVNTVTFCGVDTKDRRWTLKLDDGQTIDCKVFGFVARKPNSSTDNACHIFGEMDPNQPANAIVNFLTKVMIGQGHFMKT